MRLASLILLMVFLAPVRADEKVNWSATDVRGATVTVPTSGRACVIAFIRPEQAQSESALEQIKSTVADKAAVIVVISGDSAEEQAKAVAGKIGWPVVADPEFKSSGQLNVHVWPTTLIVSSSGSQCAHLAGMNDTFAADLRDRLDLATGAIDGATLQKHLATRAVVTESPAQMAGSYLQVARRLLESGELDQAQSQIEQGLKIEPHDVGLKLAMSRVLTLQNHPGDALKLLDELPAGSVPPGQMAALRGRALIGLEKWNDAQTTLEPSIGLNPDPAEADYLLGLIYQHNNDPARAAASFRKAYESRERTFK